MTNTADDLSGAATERVAPAELDWTKPGPGTWQLDGSHFTPDCARLVHRIIEFGFSTGIEEGFDLIGAPLRKLEAAFVNGNFYIRMVPLVAGDRDLPPPLAAAVWLMTRIHPAFRKREKIARAALDGRIWNDELEKWNTEHRPFLEQRSAMLTAVDPTALDDDELAEHIGEVIDLVFHGAALHFRLHISDLGPIGLLMIKARDWGLDQADVMAAMAGASPATSAAMVMLYRIGAAAKQARPDGDPFTSLDEVRTASTEVSELLEEFLAVYGQRLTTGYDIQDLRLIELPELLLSAINADQERTAAEIDEDAARAGEEALAELLDKIPTERHDEFKRLVAESRALYGLRDENGPLTYQWPAGLLRRGLLEAGSRMATDGRIPTEAHVFDLEAEELQALLRGQPGPSHAELQQRLATRKEWTRHDAPITLGPEAEDPPLWAMPGALAELMDSILTVLDLLETSDKTPRLEGVGIGTTPMVGTARVVTDEYDALARMEPGDVLIAPFTVPTYNAALATAGAVVVENGGLLCHAAVIAREFGIPGLVGVSGVTTQITDGATVSVDPVAGTIREITA